MTDLSQKLNIPQTKRISLGDAYEHEFNNLIIIFDAVTAEQVRALYLQDLSDCTHLSVFNTDMEHFNTAYLGAV